MKTKILFLGACLLFALSTKAYDFTLGGIYYNITSSNEVSVTYNTTSYNSYSGALVVPNAVTYNSKTYTVTSIGESAFNKCTGLTSITIPNSVISIGGSGFNKCTVLTTINIPNSVTSIGDYAFNDCTGITSITIPSSVTSIGIVPFLSSGMLVNVDINNPNYSSDNGVLFNKTKTVLIEYPLGTKNISYTIPKSVTSIGESAFYGCANFSSVIIPNSITSIGASAFFYCTGLTTITLPNSVNSIGSSTFFGCTNLTSIHANMTTPVDLSKSSDVFFNVNKSTCTLYVPMGSKLSYQNAIAWKDFTSIVEEVVINSIETVQAKELGIQVKNNKLIFSHLPVNELVFVTNVEGKTFYHQRVHADNLTVSLMNKGIFIVRIGNKCTKIINL